MHIAIATGINGLNEDLLKTLEDSEIVHYREYLTKEGHEHEVVILSRYLNGDIEIEQLIFMLKQSNTRIIYLTEPDNEEEIRLCLKYSVYDIIFNPLSVSKIIDVYKNPKSFADVSKLYVKYINNEELEEKKSVQLKNLLPLRSDNDDKERTIKKESGAVIEKVIIEKVYETPHDYKKKIGFIGHSCSGVTSIICWLAQCLSDYKVKVAILDLTDNKDLYEIYPFDVEDDDIKKNQSKQSLRELTEGVKKPFSVNKYIDLYTASYPFNTVNENAQKLLHAVEEDYSVILVDMAYSTPLDLCIALNNVYIVQTQDVKKLKCNTEYLLHLKEFMSIKKVKYIFNQLIPCCIKVKDLQDFLKVHVKLDSLEKVIIRDDDADYFEVPYSLKGHVNSYEHDYSINKVENEFKQAITKIAADIYPINCETNKKKNSFIRIFNKKN